MDEYQEAREIALRFLDYQPRTTAEIRRRLARAQAPEAIVDAVIADLHEAGLLDDARFSQAWIADRSSRKGYGRTRLAAELRMRGVDKRVVDEAVEAVDPAGELAAATDLARKRLAADDDPSEPGCRRRLAAFLRRRGYEWDVIESALTSIVQEDDS